jgi:hypothetical protein
LSSYDDTGKEDGLGCFIFTECPELCPVIAACKDSAKMAMKALVELLNQEIACLKICYCGNGKLACS